MNGKFVLALSCVVIFLGACGGDLGRVAEVDSSTYPPPTPSARTKPAPAEVEAYPPLNLGAAVPLAPNPVSPGAVASASSPAPAASASPVASVPAVATSGDQLKRAGLTYTGNTLVYQGPAGEKKVLQMGMQTLPFEYECAGLIPGMQHPLTVQVQVAFNPSKLWEVEYSRLFAIYQGFGAGAKKGEVTKDDLYSGMRVYLGQYQEKMCAMAGTKSIKEIVANPVLGQPEVARLIGTEKGSPFEVKVQTIRVVLPEKLLRALVRDFMK